MQDAGNEADAGTGTSYRLRIYAAAAALLVVMALLSFLIVPHGSGASLCMSYLLDNNKYSCLTNLAVSSQNASVCARLPEQGAYPAGSCYSQVAQRSDNASVCGKIANATDDYACVYAVAVATDNYSLCSGMGKPYAGRCADEIAVLLGRPSLCAAGNATSAEECSSIIYVNRMLRNGSAGYCANVSAAADENVANYVISNVTYGLGSALSNVSTYFLSLSFMPNATYSARDFCYDLAAEKLHDAALCQDIVNGRVASECGSQFEAAQSNSTINNTQLWAICSQLGSGSQACQALRMAQALYTDNASECGSLVSLSVTCYSHLAAEYNNTAYCRYIANESAESACLSSA